MLIGAARIITQFRKEIRGSVRFVFQPGEEIVAAGKDLIEAGALEFPVPKAVLALHAWPGNQLGSISSIAGPIMAAADFFSLQLLGNGGHGACPENTTDPIHLASNLIQMFYQIIPRRFRSLDPVVISICRINGGKNANTIPDKVEMEGTCRYFDRTFRKKIPQLLHSIIRHECEIYSSDYKLDYRMQYLPTVNTPEVVSRCKSYTEEFLGKKIWHDMSEPVMPADDFSYYIDHHPGAMFFLGMGEGSPQLHTNTFNFNDEALANGILFLVVSAMKLLDS
jgi:amidohydrolase